MLSDLCALCIGIVTFFVSHVRADLPVHCLRHQIVGDWQFTLGPTGPERTPCGHQRPDNQDNQPPADFLSSLGATTDMHISLQDPDTAQADDGSIGTWTMIYDEGFEVAVGNSVFFAFSDFEFKEDPETQSKHNISHCDATKVGWYHDKARTRWGCYIAKKTDALVDPPVQQGVGEIAAHPAVTAQSEANVSTSDVERSTDTTPASTNKTLLSSLELDEPASYTPWVPGSAGYEKPMVRQWQQSVVDALNFLQLGWTAATYDRFEGKTPRQLNKFAGVRRARPLAKTSKPKSALESSFSSFLGLRTRVRRANQNDSFDWRKHKGKNWLTSVVEQGDCGSCYTISTVHMLTARNRIAHDDVTEPAFSVSFPLYCGEYTQGCDGGYGFLQTKWSEDVGLIPESCAPFSQGGGACSKQSVNSCDLGMKRYRAMGHHYVGGFYGGATEENIKKELVSNGPMVMSFEPKEDFMYYKDGVYTSGPNRIHQEWEQVDHAVLLVGVGVDNGQRYWTMQNSWGTDWGEDGYFRMARGTDESGCESIVVAANVVQESDNPILEKLLASV